MRRLVAGGEGGALAAYSWQMKTDAGGAPRTLPATSLRSATARQDEGIAATSSTTIHRQSNIRRLQREQNSDGAVRRVLRLE